MVVRASTLHLLPVVVWRCVRVGSIWQVEHRTKLGTCDVMKQNPYNAVMALGHTNGTVQHSP